MDSRVLYTGIVAAIVLERGVELVVSSRNARRVRARGGIQAPGDPYGWMVTVHALFLPACVAEVWLTARPFLPPLAATMGALLLAALALRYWAIAALGERWNTRVLVVPGLPAVDRGPYRWMRHPNYAAVIIEVAALPLLHTAWLTATLFSVANFFLLRARIRVEEEALRLHCRYDEMLTGRGRFLPRGS